MALAFVGGTGPEGLGLVMRLAKAGEEVIIGSRSPQRAAEAVQKVLAHVPQARVQGMMNAEAVAHGHVVFVTVPYGGHKETLASLAPAIGHKLVVDVVVPLDFQRGGKISAVTVEEGSAAEQAQRLLPQAQVVSGFHHLDASQLMDVGKPITADVIICGDAAEAKRTVIALAEKIAGVRALDGGRLANSRYVEAFTAVLLGFNRTYKAHTAIRIVGI
ncbi:MAG: NADPH-dependent F420 reductase [Dehalococcoidia bacterium]